ncbi:MAG: hypothetical protein Q9225_007299 [Loekoesia sp. 1 TL-2023]
MDPSTAFSLASGVLQVLDVSSRAIVKCREMIKDGSLAEDRDTEEIADALEAAGNSPPWSKEDSETLDLSMKCCTIANELRIEIEKLKVVKGGHRQAIARTVRSMRKSRMLKEKQAKLEKYTQMLDTHVLMRLDAHSLRHSHDIDSLDREREREFEQDYEEFKASLFFKDIESRHDQISEAFKGTCRWIFDPPTTEGDNARKWSDFRDWLVAGEGAYWISGKPGSGKSTLMKYIVDEPCTAQYLSEWEQNSELIVVSFFFWNLGTELQKSAMGLLRSLLFQIAKQWPNLMNLILKAYGRSKGQSDAPARLDLLPTWTPQRLLSILEDFINKKPTTVSLCAFIDGLDEFDGDEDLLLEIVRLLSSAPGCKVCVSSRPEQACREEFQGCPQCRVQDLNENDITKMVVENLKPSLEKNLPTEGEAIDDLIHLLIEKTEGVFLWLNIMIKDLSKGSKNGDNISELYARLQRTPNTVYGLYRRILEGLDSFYLDDALRIFQILITASSLKTPVSVLGLACAEDKSWAYIKQFDRAYFGSPSFDSTCLQVCTRLNSRCGSFIEFAESPDQVEGDTLKQHCRTISFIHRTVAEFLKEEYKNTFDEFFWLSPAGVTLARANIGLIVLFPLTRSFKGVEFGSDGDHSLLSDKFVPELRLLIEDTMTAISFIECSAGVPDFSIPLESVQLDLTAQILKTLQYMATSDETVIVTSPDQNYPMKSIVNRVDHEYMDWIDADQHLFMNHMSYAAFWGCRSYIQFHMSIHTFSEGQVDDMFKNAVIGLHPYFGKSHSFMPKISILLTLKLLLQDVVIPGGETSSWWRQFRRFGWRASPWGAFILHACETSYWSQFESSREKRAWIACLTDLIKRFLSLGADVNTRISLSIELMLSDLDEKAIASVLGPYSEEFPQCILFLDESPLACSQVHQRKYTEDLCEIETLLRSRGAINRRRFRFLGYGESCYRISISQSDALRILLYPDGRFNVDFECYGFVSAEFIRGYETEQNNAEFAALLQDILSTNDQVDWDILDKEWKAGGSDWLEDEEIRSLCGTSSIRSGNTITESSTQ